MKRHDAVAVSAVKRTGLRSLIRRAETLLVGHKGELARQALGESEIEGATPGTDA